MLKKYRGIAEKISRLLVLCIFFNTGLNAQQQEWPDTVTRLKYEIDTTALPDTLVANTGDGDYEDGSDKESEPEKEYFLRKEFTGGLADTLQFRRLPGSRVKALRNDKAFWYANESFKKKEKKKRDTGFSSNPVFQSILWLVIIGGFITFLVIYLSNSNAGLFRKSRKIAEEETGIETGDIFTINYQHEIDKAVEQNNFRLAVRLRFLRLLRDLSDKNIIQYKQDSTNFDYLVQLRKSALYADFFRLARNYEYSWYGQFEIDKAKYSIIKNDFENFERRLTP
jgi:hypothetical protein